jgi:hypothetical protein
MYVLILGFYRMYCYFWELSARSNFVSIVGSQSFLLSPFEMFELNQGRALADIPVCEYKVWELNFCIQARTTFIFMSWQ